LLAPPLRVWRSSGYLSRREIFADFVIPTGAARYSGFRVRRGYLLGIDQYAGYAGFTTTKPFNGVQIVGIAVLSVASELNVYSACVSH
jgi:hypothetical protein